MRHAFIVDIAASARAVRDLSAGGVFVADAEVALEDVCNVILRAGTTELRVVARVVLVTDEGAGLEIDGLTNETRQRIAELVEIAQHLDLERRKTLTGLLATEAGRRRPLGSLPPENRRVGGHRLATGSIAPPSQSTVEAGERELSKPGDDDDD